VPSYEKILAVEGFGPGGTLTVKFVPDFYHGFTADQDLNKKYLDIRERDHLGDDENGEPIEC